MRWRKSDATARYWGQFIPERTTGYRRYFFIRVTASCAERNVPERCYRRLKGFRCHALQQLPRNFISTMSHVASVIYWMSAN
jgi:hypothetical protein